jgi:hypothetical protein
MNSGPRVRFVLIWEANGCGMTIEPLESKDERTDVRLARD